MKEATEMSQQSLTMREVAEVERLSGLSMNQVDESAPVGLYLAAVGTVLRKRVDPDFTFDQALDLTMPELLALNGEVDEDPKAGAPDTPTAGSGSRPSSASARASRRASTRP